MPMIPLTRTLETRLKQDFMQPDTARVSVRTYKGDRGFILHRSGDTFELQVDGFQNETHICTDWKAVTKVLKKVLRREFPRSHTVRYTVERS